MSIAMSMRNALKEFDIDTSKHLTDVICLNLKELSKLLLSRIIVNGIEQGETKYVCKIYLKKNEDGLYTKAKGLKGVKSFTDGCKSSTSRDIIVVDNRKKTIYKYFSMEGLTVDMPTNKAFVMDFIKIKSLYPREDREAMGQKFNDFFTLEEAYKFMNHEMDNLRDLTMGDKFPINPRLIGDTQRMVKWYLAYKMNKLNMGEIPIIKKEESQWIQDSIIGQYVYHKKGTYDEVSGYDFNAHFPSILTRLAFNVPVCEGEFVTLTTDDFNKTKNAIIRKVKEKIAPGVFAFGIYVAKVTGMERLGDKAWHWRNNYLNHYTHIDLAFALELGLDVELVQDGFPNYYKYDVSVATGKGIKCVSA